ncbi:MAG: hypothetical protein C4334_00400 [Pyrinomonas sp.]
MRLADSQRKGSLQTPFKLLSSERRDSCRERARREGDRPLFRMKGFAESPLRKMMPRGFARSDGFEAR